VGTTSLSFLRKLNSDNKLMRKLEVFG